MAQQFDSNLRSAQENITKSAEKVLTDASSKVQHMASDISDNASEYASDFMNSAQNWLESNTGKAVSAVTVFAAVGIAAYFLGRSSMTTLESTAKSLKKHSKSA